MKFVDSRVVFREVPDEITLAINISNCPVHCPGCHSSYLWEDCGEILDSAALEKLILSNPGISCISFNGGDADPAEVAEACRQVREKHPSLKTCWYSGRGLNMESPVLPYLDFIKTGPYIESAGGLDSPTTNQRFYSIRHTDTGAVLNDDTHKFQKKIYIKR